MWHRKQTKRIRVFYLSDTDKIWEVESLDPVPPSAVIKVKARDPSDANRLINRKLERRELLHGKMGSL
jgi:hypothetical protein